MRYRFSLGAPLANPKAELRARAIASTALGVTAMQGEILRRVLVRRPPQVDRGLTAPKSPLLGRQRDRKGTPMQPTGRPAAPIHIKWPDVTAFTFEPACEILQAPQRIPCDRRRLRAKPDRTGRIYLTVAEVGRLLVNATAPKGTDR